MLEALVARAMEPAGLVRRARVILWSAAGEAGVDVASRLDLSPEAVSRIRGRFAREGVDGLLDRPKAGRRDHAVPAETVEAIVQLALSPRRLGEVGGRPVSWAKRSGSRAAVSPMSCEPRHKATPHAHLQSESRSGIRGQGH